jgi:hypothetical protein
MFAREAKGARLLISTLAAVWVGQPHCDDLQATPAGNSGSGVAFYTASSANSTCSDNFIGNNAGDGVYLNGPDIVIENNKIGINDQAGGRRAPPSSGSQFAS